MVMLTPLLIRYTIKNRCLYCTDRFGEEGIELSSASGTGKKVEQGVSPLKNGNAVGDLMVAELHFIHSAA
jgi:hypothetical protein